VAKVIRTRWYSFIGDCYEYHGQDPSSRERTHSDVGWRLRSKIYRGVSTFKNLPLSESLEQRPCPLDERDSGIYILRDSIFPEGFYVGKGKKMHERIWKHGVKLTGTQRWNKAVETTVEFERYRKLREAKGLNTLEDVEIAFWFTDKIDELEDQILGAYTAKYNRTPFCNSAEEAMFEAFDI